MTTLTYKWSHNYLTICILAFLAQKLWFWRTLKLVTTIIFNHQFNSPNILKQSILGTGMVKNLKSRASCTISAAKMAQYHLFLKFLATKHCFGNYWGSTTFSGTRVWWARVPYFLIHRGTMTWKTGIKIFCLVLEHVKLEY